MAAIKSGGGFWEFLRFLGVGGIAALANLVSRYLLDFMMPFEVAVVLAYMVGMVVGFFLFQRMLFGGNGVQAKRVVRFIWVNILGAALAWAVSSIMARIILPGIGWDWHMFEVAHLFGVATPAISSYVLHKHDTFA